MGKNTTKLSPKMKREGRQHGMVWTTPQRFFTRDTSRSINEITSPLTAGLFSKVPSKPTNHSKFTGRVGGHMFRPAYKSKDKVKGTQKIRSSSLDVGLINNGLLKSFSATDCALYMEELDRDHYYVDNLQ